MKKITLFISLLFFIFNFSSLNAQESSAALPSYDHKVELTPLVGFMLTGTLNFIQGDIRFNDNLNYGGALAVNTGWGTFAEAIYTFTGTEATFRSYYNGFDSRKFDVDIHYIQIGGVKEFKVDRIRPFGTLGIGASGFVPKNQVFDSWWSFAMNMGLGVKIHLSEHIGIRLQARLLVPLYFSGVAIFGGSGGGGAALTASSNIIQGDFMGGLVFGF